MSRRRSKLRDAAQALAIAKDIHPFLRGKDPGLQGAIILDLLSTWLAGWPRQARKEMLDDFLEALPGMIECSEKQMFGESGHPGNERIN